MLLDKKPVLVAVVAAFPPPPAGMTLQAEMLAALLRRDGAAVVEIDTNPFGRRYPRLRRFLHMIRELTKLRACDVAVVFAGSYASFFAFTAVPLACARLAGVPALVMYKGGWADAFLKRWGWLVRRWLGLARAVVVPGRFYQDVFARFGVAAHVVPDILGSTPAPPRRPAGPRRVVINPRRHDFTAGTDLLLDAFAVVAARADDVDLHLYGEGRDTRRYREQAGALADTRVFFHGFIPHAELAPRLAEATFLVNANRFDNHPNSVLEAMLAGVPVVATAVGGVPYLIQDGVTGFLSSPDAAALAERMLYVLEHSQEADAAAARAREAAPAFIWPYNRPGHLDVVLALSRRRPRS